VNKIYDFESGILPIEEKRFDEIVYNDIRLSICEAFLALDDNCQAEHIEYRNYLLSGERCIAVQTALRSEQNNHRKHLFEEKAKQLKQIVSDYVDSQVAYFTYAPKDSEK
jgi:hypothetical protein